MKSLRAIRNPEYEVRLEGLSWIPEDIQQSLSAIVPFLIQSLRGHVSEIGLYGSWQRNTASLASDVDLVILLDHEVEWFDADRGIVDRSAAHAVRRHWQALEQAANARRFDARVYSIAVVTPGMLAYYAAHGQIRFQNWVHALRHCHSLWKKGHAIED